MINKQKDNFLEENPELNTLKVLIQSLKYQFSELNKANQKIEQLKLQLRK